MKQTLRFVRHVSALLVTLAALLTPRPASAESMTLLWDFNIEPEVTGYIVYVGSQSGVYPQSFDVGNTNTFVFDGAVAGQRYYFAVAAYAGVLVSELSAEVSGEATGTANAAPYLLSPGNQTTVVGQAVSLQLVGGDSQGDPVTYSASGLPPGLAVGQSSGLVVGVPTTAGTYSVTAGVSDGTLSTQRTFTWSIMQATTAPTTSTSTSSPTSSTSSSSTGSTAIIDDGTRSIRQLSGSTYTGTTAVRRPVEGATSVSRTYTGTAALARSDGTTSGTTAATGTSTGTTALTRSSSTATGTTATSSTTTPMFPYTGTRAVRSVPTAPESSSDPATYTSTFESAPFTAAQTGTTTAGTTTTGTAVYTAPGVRIQTPTDGSSFAAGTPVILAGVAEDAEDGTLSTRIVWSSSVDGPLGTGGLVYRTLSPGVHIITALVSDSHGNVRMARVAVTVTP